MSAKLKEKIDEISLLLLMTSEGDEPGVQMLVELLKDLADLAQNEAADGRLAEACKWATAKKGEQPNGQFLELLKDLLSKAQLVIDNPSGHKLPNETGQQTAQATSEVVDNVDTTFLAEFIETHSMQLEDFEGSLLEAEFGAGNKEEFETGLKRYIHTLKGDAGSVGLNQISSVCHDVEDILVHHTPQELMGQLVLFKEWVCACLKAYTSGATPSESAASFMERFRKASGLVLSAPSSSPKAAPEKKVPQAACVKPDQKVPQELGEYKLSGESDLLIEFIVEAEEHLNNVESVVLSAAGSYDQGSIDTIFRGVHSIKGGSAYFNLEEMTKTSHLLENMLSEVRDGKRTLDQVLSNLVLSFIDLQKSLLAAARQAQEKDGTISRTQAARDFLAALEAYIAGKSVEAKAPVAATAREAISGGANAVVSAAPAPSKPKSESPEGESEGKEDKLNVKTFVKIDTGRLDHLIDSIGEMVIYSSMLIRHCRQYLQENREVIDVTRRVEKFARDLQDVGMSMRLMPIKSLFQKMSRLVWDTSRKIGKQIDFSMDGEDTELDRNLIDKLADPLMHMVRNAIDHGIESPEDREKAGKPRTGAVHLSASHSGGTVLIKVRDDGRGLNQEKLLAKALEKKIISEGQKLSEQEIYQLIFAPGFSTAAVVTDISGRGVGMDVVRKNVESLRGRVHIESELGKGSVFTIELPLTLAIIDGIQIRVGRDQFIVPSLSIVEFVRPKEDMLSYPLDRGETFNFRGKYLPVFRLADLFDIDPEFHDPKDSTYIVVENNQELIALMVDDIMGEYSTVIKSLGPMFDDNRGLSGCAIMPNGDVALILDIRSLVSMARNGYKRRTVEIENEPAQTARETTIEESEGELILH